MSAPLSSKELETLRAMGEPMSAAEADRRLRLFFYSDPKVGKTDLTARIVQELGLKAIWLHTDSGWSTVLKYPEAAKNTWRMPFDSFAQIRLICKAHDEGVEPFCSYNTLVWDTASSAINTMLRVLVKGKPLPKEQYDPTLEARGHYRMVEVALKDTIDAIKNSGMHMIFTAHIRDPTEQDREKKRFSIRPAGPEASYRVLAQEANLIGYLKKESQGSKRTVQFEPTLQETAGTQIPTIEERTYYSDEVPALLKKYVEG